MKNKRFLFASMILVTFMLVQCTPAKKSPADLDKLVPGATLIIKAKVLLLHTAVTGESDVSDKGVALVTDVIESPEALGDIKGQQITIHFQDINNIKEGEERVFFAEPYVTGENIGVKESGNMLVAGNEKLMEELPGQVKQVKDKDLANKISERIGKAEMAITGKIKSMLPMQKQVQAESEHNPEWLIVEVETTGTLKGAKDKTVRFLYPGSTDVAYRNYPKLDTEKEWFFILDRSAMKEVPYQVKSHESILPGVRFREIEKLIKK